MKSLRFFVCWLAFCVFEVQTQPAGAAAEEPEAQTTEEQAIAADIDLSLDRNDSNNTNVNWTDGLHATFRG